MNQLLEKLKQLNAEATQEEDRLTRVQTYFYLFTAGAVSGWIYELFFYWIMENRISNNGFFYGPYLPIYGFGAVFIVLFTNRIKKYPIAVFLLSIPITGVLEYITGYAMYEIWAQRWWDYRTKFLNIGGFVCLRSVLSFAVGAILLIYIVRPGICMLSKRLGKKKRSIICISLIAIFIIDCIFTVLFRMPDFAL